MLIWGPMILLSSSLTSPCSSRSPKEISREVFQSIWSHNPPIFFLFTSSTIIIPYLSQKHSFIKAVWQVISLNLNILRLGHITLIFGVPKFSHSVVRQSFRNLFRNFFPSSNLFVLSEELLKPEKYERIYKFSSKCIYNGATRIKANNYGITERCG